MGKFFFGILKVTEERSRIRIRSGSGFVSQEVWIRGSGSAPKCHRSPRLLFTLTIAVPCAIFKNCLIYSKYLCRGGQTEEGEVTPRCGRGEVGIQETQE
jgi:hypothetical protein